MTTFHRLFLIVHFSFFIIHFAQAQIWVGLRVEYDEHVAAPLPLLITLRPDSTAEIRTLDADSTARQTRWAKIGNRTRLDTNTFAPGQWRTVGNELRIGGRYPMMFRALLPDSATGLISSRLATARTLLTDHSWITDSLIYHLYANGQAGIENRRTGDLAQHCWQLLATNGAVFLVLKGNRQTCDGQYLFTIQVLNGVEKSVTVLTTNGYDQRRQIWQRVGDLAENAAVEPRGFQTCQPVVYAPMSLYPYKQFRQGRLGRVRAVVMSGFRAVAQPGQSGLIRLRFVVNCTGQAGRWELLELDENYQKRPFDPQITRQILTICRTRLTEFEPGLDDNNQPRDTVCLLTFRLKDGQIIEIFP